MRRRDGLDAGGACLAPFSRMRHVHRICVTSHESPLAFFSFAVCLLRMVFVVDVYMHSWMYIKDVLSHSSGGLGGGCDAPSQNSSVAGEEAGNGSDATCVRTSLRRAVRRSSCLERRRIDGDEKLVLSGVAHQSRDSSREYPITFARSGAHDAFAASPRRRGADDGLELRVTLYSVLGNT